MPIQVLSCAHCGAAAPEASFEPLACSCPGCDTAHQLRLPTDGELRAPTLGAAGLSRRAAWRQALAQRQDQRLVIVAPCPACQGPLTAPRDTQLQLACQYCGQPSSFTLGDHVADTLPSFEVAAATWGGGLHLSWTPEHWEAGAADPVRCPGCSATVAPFFGLARCAHCDTALLALHACGRRVLPGIRLRGFDEGRQVDRWLPLHEALDQFQGRQELVRHSRRTTCLVMALFVVLAPAVMLGGFIFGVTALMTDHPRLGIALVLSGGLGAVALFGGLIYWAISGARRKRLELM